MFPPIDDLVQSISLYKPYPLLLHGYLLPFIISYSSWLGVMTFVYGWEEYFEIGCIMLAIIGCLQILTCLFCHWFVHIRCLFTCKRERSPWKAQLAKVIPTANNGSIQLVKLHKSYNETDESEEVWFIFQKTKYILEAERKQFKPLSYPTEHSFLYYAKSKGLTDNHVSDNASQLYGLNVLKMDIPEFMELFRDRATAPFFVFQVFCVGLWCLEEYWYYSLFTLFMLVVFECTLVQQQLRNMAEIRKMGNKPYQIQVYRNMTWKKMMTDELLPGDIISIGRSENDNLVPCDLLLLRGPCVVDESMLTGESIPQMKESLEGLENKLLDMVTDSKLHVLFGGTKVVQHTPPIKQPMSLKAPDNGCICYVLRTSFSTAQGRLLRTILYSVSRITANTLETFAFILFLLVFAIAAASYVWIQGTQDPDRNRYKLFLECTLILTSVVPPELPIELSLAVNNSLLALSKLAVFCTEPFRIPLAGKVDICCFDKTGTLTSDELIVEGVSGINGSNDVIPAQEAPFPTIQVLASCHSLVQVDEGLVGDPQEKVTLSEIGWYLNKGDSIYSKKGKSPPLRIAHRFHFSSQLKRMSVVASYTPHGMTDSVYIASVKGAPEMLMDMFCSVPENYNQLYQELTRRGTRVLALGRKELGRLHPSQVRQISRESIEKDLEFKGFIIFSCPLKKDSLGVIKEIKASSHGVVMITGDNSLTACHVANALKFTRNGCILCLEKIDFKWFWRSIDEQVIYKFESESTHEEILSITNVHDLCVTGEGFTWLSNENPEYLKQIFSSIKVFARVAPKEKEHIITTYKSMGYTTLMCGDGTNDVGALKHAHCGVAILTHGFDKPIKSITQKHTNDVSILESRNDKDRRLGKKEKLDKSKLINDIRSRNSNISDPRLKRQEDIKKLLKEFENLDQNQLVKLGDASIAAPFTSKRSSIVCVNHIIKQGRCTLVTTLQMFKILALNALIHAYSHSVLYIDGIKFSDYQATLQGILLAFCFLFISRSKPLKTLSSARPLPNIFNMYTIVTVLLQFSVHFFCLIYLVQQAKSLDGPQYKVDIDKEFAPSVLNSTVYIISMTLQISTFAINYRGHPFMESLTENKVLLYSLLTAGCLVMTLALGISPQFAYQFEIVEFPTEFRGVLVKILLADFFCSLAADRLCLFLFGEGKLSKSFKM